MRSSLIESASTPPPLPRQLGPLRARLRVLHCAIRTEQVHVNWARRFSFILYQVQRHPHDTRTELPCTQIDTHVMNCGGRGVLSPFDKL